MEDRTIFVEDGTGSGKKMAVTTTNLGKVLAFTMDFEHSANHRYLNSYSLVWSIIPNEDSFFLWIKNTSDLDLTLTSMGLYGGDVTGRSK